MKHAHSPLTVSDIQSIIDHDSALLANIDAFVALQKTATQAHKDALTAALSITDDTKRQAAVDAANEAMRKTIDDAIAANPALASAMHGPMMMGKNEHHKKGIMSGDTEKKEKHHGKGAGMNTQSQTSTTAQ